MRPLPSSACQTGDHVCEAAVLGNGFVEMATRYDAAILSLFLALTSSQEVALDLCHATMVAAHRQLGGRGAPSPFIDFYRIAVHQWLGSAARSRMPQSDALHCLSDRERLVFTLKARQRLTLTTVARILEESDQAIARTFTRACTKLREQVAAE